MGQQQASRAPRMPSIITLRSSSSCAMRLEWSSIWQAHATTASLTAASASFSSPDSSDSAPKESTFACAACRAPCARNFAHASSYCCAELARNSANGERSGAAATPPNATHGERTHQLRTHGHVLGPAPAPSPAPVPPPAPAPAPAAAAAPAAPAVVRTGVCTRVNRTMRAQGPAASYLCLLPCSWCSGHARSRWVPRPQSTVAHKESKNMHTGLHPATTLSPSYQSPPMTPLWRHQEATVYTCTGVSERGKRHDAHSAALMLTRDCTAVYGCLVP